MKSVKWMVWQSKGKERDIHKLFAFYVFGICDLLYQSGKIDWDYYVFLNDVLYELIFHMYSNDDDKRSYVLKGIVDLLNKVRKEYAGRNSYAGSFQGDPEKLKDIAPLIETCLMDIKSQDSRLYGDTDAFFGIGVNSPLN